MNRTFLICHIMTNPLYAVCFGRAGDSNHITAGVFKLPKQDLNVLIDRLDKYCHHIPKQLMLASFGDYECWGNSKKPVHVVNVHSDAVMVFRREFEDVISQYSVPNTNQANWRSHMTFRTEKSARAQVGPMHLDKIWIWDVQDKKEVKSWSI